MTGIAIIQRDCSLGDIILLDPLIRQLSKIYESLWFLTRPHYIYALQGHPNLQKIITKGLNGEILELQGQNVIPVNMPSNYAFYDMNGKYENNLEIPFCEAYLRSLNLPVDDTKINIYLSEEEKTSCLPEGDWVVVDTGYPSGRHRYCSESWDKLFDYFRSKKLKVVRIGNVKTTSTPDLDLTDKNQPMRKMFSTINSGKYFIGIDSGPLHIAKALKKPGVGIYCAYKLNVKDEDTVIPYFCNCYSTEPLRCGMVCKKSSLDIETLTRLFDSVLKEERNSKMKTILITGAAGFIGSHTVEHIHRKTDWNIIVIDKLTYASKGLDRLRDNEMLQSSRVKIFAIDLCSPISEGIRREIGHVDYILHMAAETHVDNSIKDPVFCIQNNVMSTTHLLEYARTLKGLEKFFYFSTDEVFGTAPPGVSFSELDRHCPTNPYSASKSAAENICISYQNTYKIPVVIMNVMNAFGERQHVEKFIPKCIKYILEGKTIDIHADPECKVPGSRFYIHARNIAGAVLFLINNGKVGEKYNVSGEKEVDNLELAKKIASIMGRELKYNMVNFHGDRPGHDLRYCLNGEKLKEMGWTIPVSFEESLKKTVLWTIEHPKWLEE